MKHSFYNSTTGVLHHTHWSGPVQHLAINTPEGFTAIEGALDPLHQRVDVATGQVVAYTPPKPEDTAHTQYQWVEGEMLWVGQPTDARLAVHVRADRNLRLAKCDWVVCRAFEHGMDHPPLDWCAYRDALRHVPEQPGFPHVIDWPEPPDA